MRYQLLALAAATLASAQSSTVTPAPAVTGNVAGEAYVATLPKKEGSALAGSLHAVSAADGTGVKFTVSISGLPAEGGPFMYHIHEKPVPSDGNCTGTGAHLDPYKRGEVPICDASKPETCQTGDLSGKFGNMTSQSWSQEYVDLYSSTQPGTPAYFGDLSFVVHLSNKTRIGCANFTKVSGDHSSYPSSVPSSKPTYTGGSNTSYPHPTGVLPSPSSSPSSVPEFPGAASHMGAAPAVAVMMALGAALML